MDSRALLPLLLDRLAGATPPVCPLPADLQRLVCDYAREAEPLPVIERRLHRLLLGRGGRGRPARGATAAASSAAPPSTGSGDGQSSGSGGVTGCDVASPSKAAAACLAELISHPEFPRGRCSRLLLLLDSKADPAAAEGSAQRSELPLALAAGADLTPALLDARQREQWDRLMASGAVAEQGDGGSSSSAAAPPRCAARLCAVRLETQGRNMSYTNQLGAQRVLVSEVTWTRDGATSGINAAEDAEPNPTPAQTAWPENAEFAYSDPLNRERHPLPPPVQWRPLADAWPQGEGDQLRWRYVRSWGPLPPDAGSEPLIDQTPPESAFVLRGPRALRTGVFESDTRWDGGGCETESYYSRQCVGVLLELPAAPVVSNAAIAAERLRELQSYQSVPITSAQYFMYFQGREDEPPQAHNGAFIDSAAWADVDHAQRRWAALIGQPERAQELDAPPLPDPRPKRVYSQTRVEALLRDAAGLSTQETGEQQTVATVADNSVLVQRGRLHVAEDAPRSFEPCMETTVLSVGGSPAQPQAQSLTVESVDDSTLSPSLLSAAVWQPAAGLSVSLHVRASHIVPAHATPWGPAWLVTPRTPADLSAPDGGVDFSSDQTHSPDAAADVTAAANAVVCLLHWGSSARLPAPMVWLDLRSGHIGVSWLTRDEAQANSKSSANADSGARGLFVETALLDAVTPGRWTEVTLRVSADTSGALLHCAVDGRAAAPFRFAHTPLRPVCADAAALSGSSSSSACGSADLPFVGQPLVLGRPGTEPLVRRHSQYPGVRSGPTSAARAALPVSFVADLPVRNCTWSSVLAVGVARVRIASGAIGASGHGQSQSRLCSADFDDDADSDAE